MARHHARARVPPTRRQRLVAAVRALSGHGRRAALPLQLLMLLVVLLVAQRATERGLLGAAGVLDRGTLRRRRRVVLERGGRRTGRRLGAEAVRLLLRGLLLRLRLRRWLRLVARRTGGQLALAGEHEARPAARDLGLAPHDLGQGAHPGGLIAGAVGVEVDDLAVGEAQAEPFLDEHVAFFLRGEGRAPPRTAFAGEFLLGQGGLVID